jgi:hypothetical protein
MDKKELRTRITQEDTLLGSRTEAFLLGSGFLMTALGISDVDFEKSAIGVLGLFISLIWFLVGWQSRQAITSLHNLYHREFPDDEINRAVFSKSCGGEKSWGRLLDPQN